MQIARCSADGRDRWGTVEGSAIRLASESVTLESALADRELLHAATADLEGARPLEDVVLRAPLPNPPQFIGIGMNYRDHVAEVGAPMPELPVTFGFYPNAIVGHGAEIEMPPFTTAVDWEAELAVVIGCGGRDIPIDRALDAVAGYTIVNDVSARDVQMAEAQWGRAKSFDAFKPMGPWIVTVDELGDASGQDIALSVNGTMKQSSNTAQLIFDVPFLVSHLSQSFTLLPGAVISTGTPGGVGFSRTPPEYLSPGDRVEIVVEGIGRLANTVVSG